MKRPPPIRLTRRERGWRLALCAAATLAALWILLVPTALKPAGGFCAFNALSGLPCGLCGGTRALRAAVHGNLGAALHYNAAALPIVALTGLILTLLAVEGISGKPSISRLGTDRLRRLILFGFACFVAWSLLHAAMALRNRHPELVDENHPVVRALRRAAE